MGSLQHRLSMAHIIEPEDITATCDESTTHAENRSETINNDWRKTISPCKRTSNLLNDSVNSSHNKHNN